MSYRISVIAAGTFGLATLLAGCMDAKDSAKDDKVGIDEAKSAKAPSKIERLIGAGKSEESKKTTTASSNYMQGPLETELEKLKAQAEADRNSLKQVREQSDEFKRRTQETETSLKRTEEKMAKVQRVINMLNDDPNALDNNVSLKKEIASEVPGLGGDSGTGTGFGNSLPTLSGKNSASPLAGGPGTDADIPDSALPRNGMKVNGKKSAAALDSAPVSTGLSPEPGALTPAQGWGNSNAKSLAPVSAPAFNESPELTEKTSAPGVWSEKNVPSAQPEGRVLVIDGSAGSITAMISLGKKDGLTEGMLFEASGAGGQKSILVVTKVYDTNALAKLHPRYAKNGVQEGASLKKIAGLPE